ncbi:MAG: ArsA family ATPase [Leptospiraceae bacterium]|nr:ArsA family ATPase [Leptospiraceae bacterium]MDW7976663.1 ArsA family ATPase [Leptospiraceae bacterium]
MLPFTHKVLFVLGKGGVGRTTISTALGLYFAELGKKTLIIQWSLKDLISPIFQKEPVGHKHKEIYPNLYIMNYDPEITLKEYFVDHLNMTLFYKFIIENPQVKKLLQATPGLEEVFFLGRIFWLVELAKEERGYEFDKIIVDTPATGHGGALFGVISTISNFQFQGPLIYETTRVAKMLQDQEKVGTILVTLPEELPFEETKELYSLIKKEMKRNPIALFVNKSIQWYLNGTYNFNTNLFEKFDVYKDTIKSVYLYLKNKFDYEVMIKNEFKEKTNVYSIPDLIFMKQNFDQFTRIQKIKEFFTDYG